MSTNENSEWYHIVLRATGISERAGPECAEDITKEFLSRPWHKNVKCIYDPGTHSLVLAGENDYDESGLALLDEFSDAICAYLMERSEDGGDLIVESVKRLR